MGTAYCEASAKVCLPRKSDGESCKDDDECLGECNRLERCTPPSGFANAARCSGVPDAG